MRFWIALFLLKLKKFFVKISSIFGTLTTLVLTPKEHERLTRHFYQQKEAIEAWGDERLIERGLEEEEKVFVKNYLKEGDRCLVLHCGGGREAAALAKRGFLVTGIDTSPLLIERAKRYTEAKGLRCRYILQDALELSLEERFEAILLTSNMYSAIPLKERRVAFLQRVREHLVQGGMFFVQFASSLSPDELRHYPLKKFFANLFGNHFYELGDGLFSGWHYIHVFRNEQGLRIEFDASGLETVTLDFSAGYAVLRSA